MFYNLDIYFLSEWSDVAENFRIFVLGLQYVLWQGQEKLLIQSCIDLQQGEDIDGQIDPLPPQSY